MAALLGADAGISARRVDKGDHRNFEALGHVEQPHGLAIALGPRHAEIMLEPTLGVGAFFVTDDAHAVAAEAAEPADNGGVLTKAAIARERGEVGDELSDVIEGMGPLRMPGNLRLLPGGQFGIELLERLTGLGLHAGDFVADGDGVAGGLQRPHFFNFGLELGHRFFEIQVGTHRYQIFASASGCKSRTRLFSRSSIT